MSNSSLVSYTRLSPNHSGRRTRQIDRITPHCVVGQLSAESICSCFVNSRAQASCNYGIGSDGRIALCVDESKRSWCSSNFDNDQRAVTIECASDVSSPYAMNDKVYKSLVNLCVDICKRNGKKKLLWLADKEKTLRYAPKSNEMVLTVHRWFANKACPGDWLYSRLGQLSEEVTKKLGGTIKPASSTTFDVTYAVKTKNRGVLPAVKNLTDYAGVEGDPVLDITVKASKGSVKYRCFRNGTWGGYVTDSDFSFKDFSKYAGDDKNPITAFECTYYTPSGNTSRSVYTRVSTTKSTKYYSWQKDAIVSGNMDGYAGDKKNPIDKIQMEIK